MGRIFTLPSRTEVKRDRQAKQRALISAATRLFASRGYETTTTREIAAHAGCAEGLIHRYFKGKAGLLFAIIKLHSSDEEGAPDSAAFGASLEEEVQQLMEWRIDRIWKKREFLRVTLSRAILEPKLGKFIGEFLPSRHGRIIAQRLRRQERCRLTPDDDFETLSHTIMALSFVFGFVLPAILRHDRLGAKEVAMKAARLLTRNFRENQSVQQSEAYNRSSTAV